MNEDYRLNDKSADEPVDATSADFDDLTDIRAKGDTGGIVPDDYSDLDDSDDYDDDYDDDDDDYEEYEDASVDEIDFVVAMYLEDGQRTALSLAPALANDLDDLIDQLRRLPGDAGALGALSIIGEFFVLCRVRGRNVQVLLSDSLAAQEWPIARDVVDFLGEDVPEDEEEAGPIGDFGILADLGVSDFDIEQIAENLDEDSDELVAQIAKMIGFDRAFRRAIL